MSKMNSNINKMPYHLEEGGIELMKMRAKATVTRFAAEEVSRRVLFRRWSVGVAVAACVVLVVLGSWFAGKPMEVNHFDILMEQVANAPIDVIYDMSIDAVEYAEDINLL